MAIKQIDYNTIEYKKMVALRDEILRKPIGLQFSNEDLAKDELDLLLAAFDDDEILACCILSEINATTIRLRQMAVKRNQQGKGVGHSVIIFAENLARDRGYKRLMMHARESAIGFYEKQGYNAIGERFFEVTLPHFEMEKKLG